MASYGGAARSGIIWGILSRFAFELISIPTAMIMGRLLSPVEFGVGAAVGFFVTLAQRFADFGFTVALMRQKTVSDQETSTVFFINVALGLAGWTTLAVSAQWFGTFFASPDVARAIPVAALTFVFAFVGAVPQMLIVRSMRFRALTAIDFVGMVMTSVVGVYLAWAGYGFWSLVLNQVSSTAVQTVARFFIAGWRPTLVFSPKVFWSLWSIGLGFQMKRLLDSLAQNLDNLVVGRFLGLSALGFYDKSFTMMSRAVAMLNQTAPTVSFRIFSLIYDDKLRFRAAYRKVLVSATTIAYPSFTLLAVVAPELFAVMFGPQWDSAVLPFRVLCAVGLAKLLNTYATSATQAAGLIWREVPLNAIYVGAIVVGVAVGSRWGLNGASVGVLLASLLSVGLIHDLLRRIGDFQWSDLLHPQLPGVCCAAGLAVVLLPLHAAVNRLLGHPLGGPQWLVLAAASTVLYGLLFLRFSRFSELRALVDEVTIELPPPFVRVGALLRR